MSGAVYPGSFDPITNGHLDIVARAATVFDRLIVAVLANPKKAPLLSVETRIEVIQAAQPTAQVVETARHHGLAEGYGHNPSFASNPDKNRHAPSRIVGRIRGRRAALGVRRRRRLPCRSADRPATTRPRPPGNPSRCA